MSEERGRGRGVGFLWLFRSVRLFCLSFEIWNLINYVIERENINDLLKTLKN